MTIVPRKWALLMDHKGLVWSHSADGPSGSVSTELGKLGVWLLPLLIAGPFIAVYHMLFVEATERHLWKREMQADFAAERRDYDEAVAKDAKYQAGGP